MRKLFTFLLALAACVGASYAAPAVAVNGKLPGAFSVSPTKQVNFSQGNLQYTKSTGKWKIMEHQYDVVETLNQNVGTDYASQDVVTLFGWGTSGWDNTAADATSVHYQPYSTCNTNHSTANNIYQYGPSLANVAASESWSKEVAGNHPYENYDWGVFNSGDLGAGWRTLTKDEWVYLFNDRTPGNSVNGVSNARYTEATINTDGTAVNGIILFPDDANLTIVDGVTWGNINSSSAWGTKCTTAGWTALETAGCVFLPAAGSGNGTSVNDVGSRGHYWSSSASSAEFAYGLYFYSGNVNPQFSYYRYLGCLVRLVSDIAPAPTDEQVPTNEDPENPGVYYYSTFFHSTQNYALTNDGTTAFIADLSGRDLVLTEIAKGTQVIPANTAVILRKSGSNEPVVLAPTSEPGVSFEANNDLQGVDEPTTLESLSIAQTNCYVLSGSDQYGVGFYRINATTLKAHKAYVIYSGSNGPKRMRFVFNTATGVEAVTGYGLQVTGQKLIENGQLIIIKNGVRYNAQGQVVK